MRQREGLTFELDVIHPFEISPGPPRIQILFPYKYSLIFWNLLKIRYICPGSWKNEILTQKPRTFEFEATHSPDLQKSKDYFCMTISQFLKIRYICPRSLSKYSQISNLVPFLFHNFLIFWKFSKFRYVYPRSWKK